MEHVRRALKRVDREIQQDLDDIGAVDFHAHIISGRQRNILILLDSWMHAHQLLQIAHQLPHARALGIVVLMSEKSQVTP